MARLRIRAEGLTPSAPLRGLLAVAQTIEGDTTAGGERWLGGITVDPSPCGCAETWDPACDPSPATKSGDEFPEGDEPSRDFDPFMVYQADNCSAMGLGPFEEFAARLRTTFDATQHHAIEHEFWTGTLVATNPHLASPEAQELDADALQIADAFATLETAIADSCRAGVIHITPAAAVWAARFNLIARDGQVMRTPAGTPVVVGAGYPGTGPDGDPAPEGSAWMYATGPVRVYRGEAEQFPPSIAGMTRSTNFVVVRVERPVLIEWDLCLHVAQLAAFGAETASTYGSGS